MSFWTKIRGPLELAGAAAAAYFAGPEILSMVGGAGASSAAAATDLTAGAAAADVGASAAPALATASESQGMADLFAANPSPFSMDISGVGSTASKIIGPTASAIGAMGSAGISYAGAQQTNAANAQQALQQEQFQEQMSNTAYQRGTADMKAAGLNPMLAYSQGGASTPGGAMATMTNAAGQGVSSGMQAAQTVAQLGNIYAQNDNIQANTDKTKADTANAILQGPNIEAQTSQSLASAQQARSAAQNIWAGIGGTEADTEVKIGTMASRVAEQKSQADYAATRARLAGLDVNQAQAQSDFWGSGFGKASPYVHFGTDTLSSAGRAASALRGGF